MSGFALLVAVSLLALVAVVSAAFVNVAQTERRLAANHVHEMRVRMIAESGVEYAVGQLYGIAGVAPTAETLAALCFEAGATNKLDAAARVSFAAAEDPALSGWLHGTYTERGDAFRLRVTPEDAKLNLNDSNGAWNIDEDPVPGPAVSSLPATGRLTAVLDALTECLLNGDGERAGIGATVSALVMNARDRLPGGQFNSLDEVRTLLVPDVLTAEEYVKLEANLTLHSWQDPDTIRPTFTWSISTPPGKSAIPDAYARDLYLGADMQTRHFEIEPRCPVNVNFASVELLEALIRPLSGWYLREGPGSCTTFDGELTWQSGITGTAVMQYYWDDSEQYMTSGRLTTAYEPDRAYKDTATTRLGQLHETPELARLLDGDFPRALAAALHARVHGSEALPADSFETWQEFDIALDAILLELLPDTDDALDIFWELWTPQPAAYNMTDRWGMWWSMAGGFPVRNYADYQPWAMKPETIDTAYWRSHCRGILHDLFLAAFNPNSQLNDFNPDAHIHRRIDKAQLTRYSTELSFQPCGTFRIECLGTLEDAGQARLAEYELDTVAEVCRPYRITTQAQFTQDAGQPAALSLPPAWGATTWNARVTTYPEPWIVDDSGQADGAWFADSRFDGYVMPSAWERESAATAVFTARFNGTLDGEAGSSRVAPYREAAADSTWMMKSFPLYTALENTGGAAWLPVTDPRVERLTRAAETAAPFGALLPDGALSDVTRGLNYPASRFGNGNGLLGAVEFWLKPNFDPTSTTRVRSLFMLGTDATGIRPGHREIGLWFFPHYGYHTDEIATGAYVITHCFRSFSPCSLYLAMPAAFQGAAPLYGREVMTPTVATRYPNQQEGNRPSHHTYQFAAHQWSHAVVAWNRSSSPLIPAVTLSLNGLDPAQEGPLQSRAGPPPAGYESQFQFTPPTWARFGGCVSQGVDNYVADCTVDEIVSYAGGTPPAECLDVYMKSGRYYHPKRVDAGRPEQLAVYVSPHWDPRAAQRAGNRALEIVRVAWTAYWPVNHRKLDYKDAPAGNERVAELFPLNVNDSDAADPLAGLMDWSDAGDPVSVDVGVADAAGAARWSADSNGDGDWFDDHRRTLTYAGGSRAGGMKIHAGESLAVRVYFNQRAGEIAHEAPVLDDITFYLSAGVVWKSWRSVRD